jgi:hypothetical protein
MRERLGYYQRELLRDAGDISTFNKGVSLYKNEKNSLSEDECRLIAFLNGLDEKMFGELCGREFVVDQLEHKNLINDIAFYQPLNEGLIQQSLVKFLHFCGRLPKVGKYNYPLRYSPHLIRILEKYVLIFFNAKSFSEEEFVNDRSRHSVSFFTFILFLARVYPYSQPHQLRHDLLTLRWLTQERLGHYNDGLNRQHIGLENIIAPHLLSLFADLSEELTFRIWDYLVGSDNVQKARIAVAFTLLIYFETTENLPIIPINQFMRRVQENYRDLPSSLAPPSYLTRSS